MLEGAFTSKLLRDLRRKMPQALVVKLSDRYTSGLPDFFVSLNGHTTFFEVKLASNKRIYEPLQLAMLKKLNGVYVVWDNRMRLGYLLTALCVPRNSMMMPYELLIEGIQGLSDVSLRS